MSRLRFRLHALCVCLLGSLCITAVSANDGDEVYLEPSLVAGLRDGEARTMLVYLRERADLSAAYEMDWRERGHYVHQQLVEVAERSQARLRDHLASRGVEYQAFWIDNVIQIEQGDISVLNDLATFDEVRAILGEQEVILFEPEDTRESGPLSRAVESNLTQVNAPDVWNLGYTGAGLVVGSIDTGVRYTHSALVNRYRGNLGGGNFDHNYNWWDPYDNTTVPNDTNNHGSHTTGTMVGDDGGDNQIGIAPGASWMACQGFNPASTTAGILECGQFMVAPWDLNEQNPDPDMRPHVINNSWGNCQQEYHSFYQGVVDAWTAAGIVPIFSNGNAGNCEYSRPPGLNTVGNPGRYGTVFSIGSTGKDNGEYATHSNWGPTDDPAPGLPEYPDHMDFPEIKPNVVAPGVSIRSAGRSSDTHYYMSNGTSMSAPHVAGLVALMWEAAPCLIGDYATTGTLIMQTATPVPYNSGGNPPPGDGNVPNYATGWGEINTLAAVDAALDHCGTFSMTIAPDTAAICAGDTAQYDVGVLGVDGFDDEVTLAVDDGLPGGASATFNPNPVVPADPAATSVLTIADTAGLATASHRLWISGTSSGLSGDPATRLQSFDLHVDAAAIPAPLLNGPADGETDTSLRPTFSWAGLSGEDYQIQVATDAGFADIIIDTTVTATFFLPSEDLAADVQYFWRVRGNNACGDGGWSDVFNFTTEIEPIADISPGTFQFSVPEGGSDSDVLNIGNIGHADLEWAINEAAGPTAGAGGNERADAPEAPDDAAVLFDSELHEDHRGNRIGSPAWELAPESRPANRGTGAANWQSLGPWGADVFAVVASPINPDLLLAGHAPNGGLTRGAIYRSTDGGQTWSKVPNFSHGVYDLEFAPNGTAYAGSRNLWRTTDGGQTWTELNLGLGTSVPVREVTIDPTDSSILWIGISEPLGGNPRPNLMRSTNGGQSWTDVTPPTGGSVGGRGVAIDPNDSDTAVAVFGGGTGGGQAWVTTDGGQSWSDRTSPSFSNNPLYDVHYDGTRLLVGGGQLYQSQFVGLYQSYDLGQTWQALHDDWPTPAVEGIAVDPNNPDIILAATASNGVNRSIDGGVTWEIGVGGTEGMGARTANFAPGSSSDIYVGASSLAVYQSGDGGDNFEQTSYGISELSVNAVAVDPNNPDNIAVAFEGQNTGGVYSSTDGGVTWTLESAPPTRYTAVGYSFEGMLYAISDGPVHDYQEGLYRRETDGTWTPLGPDQGSLLESRLETMRFSQNDPNMILLGGTDSFGAGTEGTIWRSLDGGGSWVKVYESPKDISLLVNDIEIVENGTDQVMVASYNSGTAGVTGGVLRSFDGGATWADSSDGLTGSSLIRPNLCASAAGSDVFFLTIRNSSSTSGVFRSDDGGITWTEVNGAILTSYVWDLACDPVDPQVLYISRQNGDVVERSLDGGVTFEPFADGLEGASQPRSLVFAGDSRLMLGSVGGAFFTDTESAGAACASPVDIPWLDISSSSGITAPGASSAVDVSVDTAALTQGDYSARLCVTTNDSDAPLVVVPVSLSVTDPTLGTLTGTVTGAGYCNADPGPLAGATVSVQGPGGTFQAVTDSSGVYAIEISENESPVSVTVTSPDYVDGTETGVTIVAGNTTTLDFDLTYDAPCATAAPETFSFELDPGDSETRTLTLGNVDGGIALDWNAETATPLSDPRPAYPVAESNPHGVTLSEVLGGPLPGVAVLDSPAGGGVNCDSGPGLIINDDGSVESGYSANPDTVGLVLMADRFTPGHYPVSVDAVCVALLTTQGGPQSVDFDVVVLADDGPNGAPGTELGAITASFDNLPVWPVSQPAWASVDISSLDITLESGSVYIGVRWVPADPGAFVAADESTDRPTGAAGGYWWVDSSGQWAPIEGSYEDYRSLFLRAATTDLTGCLNPDGVDWLNVNPVSGSTSAGATQALDITADATAVAPGTHQGYLCVASNDPHQDIIRIPVELIVAEPPPGELAVAPDALAFGKVMAGAQSTLDVSVSNAAEAGAAALTLSGLAITGAGEFDITGGDCAVSTVLEVGDSCIAEVTFSPAGAGEFQGELSVEADDGSQSAVVVLSGTGMEDPTEPGMLDVDPVELDFGTVEISESGTMNIVVSNIADADAESLELSALSIDGEAVFTISGGDCAPGLMIAPGESCSIEVAFEPDAEAAFEAAVTVATADAQSAEVALSGQGIRLEDGIFADRFQQE